MYFWSNSKQSSSPSKDFDQLAYQTYDEDEETDGYHDIGNHIADFGPHQRRDMRRFIELRVKAERTLAPKTNVLKRIVYTIRGRPSMDADILRDVVKQKEVREITNFHNHSREERQFRYKYRFLEKAPKQPEISESIGYTGNEHGDAYRAERFERRNCKDAGLFRKINGIGVCADDT